MSFQSRLKEARERKGLSRPELATLLGLSKSAISNYENGVSSPKEEIMYKIFDVLEVDPNFLFQDEYNPPSKSGVSELEKLILEQCSELNKEGQEKVLEYASGLVLMGNHKKHHSHGVDKKQA